MKLKNKNRFYKLSYFLRKLYSLKLLSFFLSENFLRKKIFKNFNDENFIVSSLKRDFSARTNDNVTVLFDTFRDGQNAFLFGVSAYGVQREGLISDRGAAINGFNLTWDTKWQSECIRFKDRFVIEMAIPFSSIKYPEGSQKWGFQTYRYDLQSNERSIWTNVDQNQIPINIGYYGALVFEEPLPASKMPIYLIPYVNGIISNNFNGEPISKKVTSTDYKKDHKKQYCISHTSRNLINNTK